VATRPCSLDAGLVEAAADALDGWMNGSAGLHLIPGACAGDGRVRARTLIRIHHDATPQRNATHEILRVERKLTQDSLQLACDESTTALYGHEI